MSDLLLFFGGAVSIIIVGIIVLYVDKLGECKHSYAKWIPEENYDAYVQFRQCEKCGYTQREQWLKIKGKNT